MPTDGILFVARSIEHVAASDHAKGVDGAPVRTPLGGNGWLECRPSLPQLLRIRKREHVSFICSLSKKCWFSLSKIKGRLHSHSYSSLQFLTCSTAP